MDSKKDFFQDVYQVVRLIPFGRVTSYGAIAKYLGAAKSSRLVGYAMNGSHHLQNPVPAHRVVNRNGMLTGKFHFDSPEAMEKALEKEGVVVKNDQVINLKDVFWDPSCELNL
ncbi:MAG: MGMT family protein [Crocinitomicaceae bacterium]|nr:MGMT family protein [Crocinitomicaceae bacterium]MBK8926806.1 MGMT family protein [Crocinitomicaceae bacterium]